MAISYTGRRTNLVIRDDLIRGKTISDSIAEELRVSSRVLLNIFTKALVRRVNMVQINLQSFLLSVRNFGLAKKQKKFKKIT
jgi:hypothetical protein